MAGALAAPWLAAGLTWGSRRHPLLPRAAIQHLPGGGPIIWFVPGRKVFLDSRQDQFPIALIEEATAVENGADPRPLLSRYGIQCVALPPASPTLATLRVDGWRVTYADAEWVVATR